jgi:hypothetical protein
MKAYIVNMPDKWSPEIGCDNCPADDDCTTDFVDCPLAAAKPAVEVDSINGIPNGTETLNGKPVKLYAVEEK